MIPNPHRRTIAEVDREFQRSRRQEDKGETGIFQYNFAFSIQRILAILSKKTDVLSSNLSVSPDYLQIRAMGA